MKTIIENLVIKMSGGTEKELPENTTIRFEVGNTSLSCKVNDEGLRIYKINNNGLEEDRIMTIGVSSNVLLIK